MQSMMQQHERKVPRPITREDLERKSKDEVKVEYDLEWTRLRSGRAGKPIHCYFVTNLSSGHEYWCELQEDDEGIPFGWCQCVAGVTCKHKLKALEDLMQREPSFGRALRIENVVEGETKGEGRGQESR